MRRRSLLLSLAATVALSACSLTPAGPALASVTRTQCLATAERYVSHRWQPTGANVFHGTDPDGVRVDTPDAAWQPSGQVAGWWRPGTENTGMPYQWGGFATPEEFDRAIAAGLAAGDVYTAEKRRLLDAAVSRHATGIDCSGLISRCWNLPRSYSTRELPSLCFPLASWDDLLPGDILNVHNAHVILFAGWHDADRTQLVAIEAGVPPHWLVVRRVVPRNRLASQGFAPFRYRGMKP